MTIIHDYLHIAVGKQYVSCPYLNNKTTKVRAGLRVHLGKGSTEDIRKEVEILARKTHTNLNNLKKDEAKKFLVDNNIGIDCSGLVYHILNEEVLKNTGKPLKKFLSFPKNTHLFRKLITQFRTVENTNVVIFSDNNNSEVIPLQAVQPGDYITMLNTGKQKNFDHILIIHQVVHEDSTPKELHYTHSLTWKKDGKYNHGVKQGIITITDPEKSILNQIWTEKESTDQENETFVRAKSAEMLEIRRIKT